MADFFNKVKDGFNKGVATVSTGSKTMIEKTKINSCIKTLEDEKKQLAELLGVKVFNFYNEKATDIPKSEIESFCNEIIARNEQIELQKKKLEELDSEMNQIMGNSSVSTGTCVCGQENAPGAKFCAKCGKAL